jgi:RNA polymerase sigma factor (sigma-70 family)
MEKNKVSGETLDFIKKLMGRDKHERIQAWDILLVGDPGTFWDGLLSETSSFRSKFEGLVKFWSLLYEIDGEDRNELFQDSFTRLFKQIQKYDPERGSLITFARLHVRSCAYKISQDRKMALKYEMPLEKYPVPGEQDTEQEDGANIPNIETLQSPTPERIVEAKETVKELWDYLQRKLTKLQMTVFRKSFLEGKADKEIVAETHLSYVHVRKILSDIRKKAKEAISSK